MLNIPHNNTSEKILIHNAHSNKINENILWSSNQNTGIFPTQSSSNGIILNYNSGSNPKGNIVLLISCVPGMKIGLYILNVYCIVIKLIFLATTNQGLLVQPEPTLFVTTTAIKSNEIGVFVSYYSE